MDIEDIMGQFWITRPNERDFLDAHVFLDLGRKAKVPVRIQFVRALRGRQTHELLPYTPFVGLFVDWFGI